MVWWEFDRNALGGRPELTENILHGWLNALFSGLGNLVFEDRLRGFLSGSDSDPADGLLGHPGQDIVELTHTTNPPMPPPTTGNR
jgi:hypothetical protein